MPVETQLYVNFANVQLPRKQCCLECTAIIICTVAIYGQSTHWQCTTRLELPILTYISGCGKRCSDDMMLVRMESIAIVPLMGVKSLN